MPERFSRTEQLFGRENMEHLKKARVAVFGIGGVGGYVVEALARSGVGTLALIDNDVVCESNINRQIIATTKTVGRYKVDVAKERILEINPDAAVHTYQLFYLPETAEQFAFSGYDYVVDAIDTVAGKLALAQQAALYEVPLISCMGTGNKMDPSAFRVADIFETSVCPLARVMRRELKKRGICHLKVVYSTEKPMAGFADADREEKAEQNAENGSEAGQRREKCPPGSNAFVPAAAGLVLAGEVIRDLLLPKEPNRRLSAGAESRKC